MPNWRAFSPSTREQAASVSASQTRCQSLPFHTYPIHCVRGSLMSGPSLRLARTAARPGGHDRWARARPAWPARHRRKLHRILQRWFEPIAVSRLLTRWMRCSVRVLLGAFRSAASLPNRRLTRDAERANSRRRVFSGTFPRLFARLGFDFTLFPTSTRATTGHRGYDFCSEKMAHSGQNSPTPTLATETPRYRLRPAPKP